MDPKKKQELLQCALAYLNAIVYDKEVGSYDWPGNKENFEFNNEYDALYKARECINQIIYNT